jgi:predicted protein tyrosine phosphatase
MKFHDLSEPIEGEKKYELFEHRDAKQVRRFIDKHVTEVENVVIHCEAGVSRSVGIAAALSRFMFGEDEVFFARGVPNARVYQKVLEELMKEAA